jgi:phosphohistidine phosphatase SixA
MKLCARLSIAAITAGLFGCAGALPGHAVTEETSTKKPAEKQSAEKSHEVSAEKRLEEKAAAAKEQETNKFTILLMRHAERPGDSTVADLTGPGYLRAVRLAPYIIDHYGKPDFIFVAQQFRKNNRPRLTAEPLAKASGIKIDDSYEAILNEELAKELLHNPKFNNKLVVIVWHHSQIPKLCHFLGATEGTYPSEWHLGMYNMILKIDERGMPPPAVTKVYEPF